MVPLQAAPHVRPQARASVSGRVRKWPWLPSGPRDSMMAGRLPISGVESFLFNLHPPPALSPSLASVHHGLELHEHARATLLAG